ncbi:MAG: MBL fold metallo-hydrolase [Verrucomicrobiales bacterium]|nr:MBL fold metallo-hydrolase [Verrucomicrobiales bacterium]
MDKFEIEVYCGGLFQTNGYLITVDDEAWLFDAPEGVTDWLAEKDVKLNGLILTHQHHDHVIGAGKLQARFNCPTWAWAEPSEELTLAKRLEEMMGVPCELDAYVVDHLFTGESTLTAGKLDLSVYHVPGHSPDSVCFLVKGQPVLVGGDVLFAGGIGRTDFPNGNHDQLLNGIREKLWPLPDETHVLPGHGPTTTIGHEKETNPFLS